MNPDRPLRRWRWLTVALCALALHAAKPSLAFAGADAAAQAAIRPGLAP